MLLHVIGLDALTALIRLA